MRGEISDGFLFPMSYLSYLDIKPENVKVGDEFDTINGTQFCEKYIPKISKTKQPGSLELNL